MIFTSRKPGTSSLGHCGSQWAKHLVDSSFCGAAGALTDSSWRSCKLVIAGRSDLCSGRKKRLTCSSVRKAFTKTMASERVTRKLHVFMMVFYCLLVWKISTKISMKYCLSGSFPRLRKQLCLSDLLYRYRMTSTVFCIIQPAYSTAFFLECASSDTWHDAVMSNKQTQPRLKLQLNNSNEGSKVKTGNKPVQNRFHLTYENTILKLFNFNVVLRLLIPILWSILTMELAAFIFSCSSSTSKMSYMLRAQWTIKSRISLKWNCWGHSWSNRKISFGQYWKEELDTFKWKSL